MTSKKQTETDMVIRGHLSEMLAAEKYVLQLVRKQAQSEDMARHPSATAIIRPLEDTLEKHARHLSEHLESRGGATADGAVKEAISVLGGKIGALAERFRDETASRMLRDTSCALGLVTTSYTMLHSAALAFDDHETSEIALKHLSDLTPFVVELSKVVPIVVVNELADSYDGADGAVGPLASNRTHEAWSCTNGMSEPATP